MQHEPAAGLNRVASINSSCIYVQREVGMLLLTSRCLLQQLDGHATWKCRGGKQEKTAGLDVLGVLESLKSAG